MYLLKQLYSRTYFWPDSFLRQPILSLNNAKKNSKQKDVNIDSLRIIAVYDLINPIRPANVQKSSLINEQKGK